MLMHEPKTLAEAMEAFTSVVDLDRWQDLEDLYSGQGGEPPEEPILPWLEGQDPAQAMATLRGAYRLVLDHLHYLDRSAADEAQRSVIFEGIRKMMLVAGDAARRLDRLMTLMYAMPERSVTTLREFEELERFYRAKVMPAPSGSEETITDLRTVSQLKADRDYELFYLHHEDGHPFVSEKLYEDVRLAEDFGVLAHPYTADDPLVRVQEWVDRRHHEVAMQLLRHTNDLRNGFYQKAVLESESLLVQALHKAMMALAFASRRENLLKRGPYKPCFQYFDDFVAYLHEALATDQYAQLLKEDDKDPFHKILLDMTQAFCQGLYTHTAWSQELLTVIRQMMKDGGRRSGIDRYADQIHNDYNALVRALRRHPNGPLFKALDLLREQQRPNFDSLQLDNLPSKLFDWQTAGHKVGVLRLPSPTEQQYIHEAKVSETYRSFLRASEGKHLLVNLQDRLSWREGARATALEQLQTEEEFVNQLTVITLVQAGDFYEQKGAYRRAGNAEQFISHFYEQLISLHSGYHFPEKVRNEFMPGPLYDLLESVHLLLFDGKTRLSRRARRDFIDLVHLFLVYRLVDDYHPHTIACVDKDGVDRSMAMTAGLDIAIKILHEKPYSRVDERHLWTVLFIPALLVRERSIRADRIQRLVSATQLLEAKVAQITKAGDRHLLQEQLGPFLGALKRV